MEATDSWLLLHYIQLAFNLTYYHTHFHCKDLCTNTVLPEIALDLVRTRLKVKLASVCQFLIKVTQVQAKDLNYMNFSKQLSKNKTKCPCKFNGSVTKLCHSGVWQ